MTEQQQPNGQQGVPAHPVFGTAPQPLPAVVKVGVTDNPPRHVILLVEDATGQRWVFLEPASAVTIGEQIIFNARQAGTSLYLPPTTPT